MHSRCLCPQTISLILDIKNYFTFQTLSVPVVSVSQFSMTSVHSNMTCWTQLCCAHLCNHHFCCTHLCIHHFCQSSLCVHQFYCIHLCSGIITFCLQSLLKPSPVSSGTAEDEGVGYNCLSPPDQNLSYCRV